MGAVAFFAFSPLAIAEPAFNQTLDALDATYYENTLRVLAGDKPVTGETKLKDRNTPGNLKLVRTYLVDEITKMGYEPKKEEFVLHETFAGGSYRLDLRDTGKGKSRGAPKGVNYWFEIPGSERPNEVVTVGAHYDSIFEGVPGANDNGTGVTAVMTLAKAFKEKGLRPKRTMRFVLFDKEEPPFSRDGSEAFFEKRLVDAPGEKHELFINVDMIGFNPHDTMHAGYSGEMFPKAQALLKKSIVKAGFPNMELTSFDPFISDNLPATFRGIPSVAICEDGRTPKGDFIDDPNNHDPEDVVKNINFKSAMRLVRWTAATALMASHTEDKYGTPESAKIHELAKNAASLKATGVGQLASRISSALEDHCMRELSRLGSTDDDDDRFTFLRRD